MRLTFLALLFAGGFAAFTAASASACAYHMTMAQGDQAQPAQTAQSSAGAGAIRVTRLRRGLVPRAGGAAPFHAAASSVAGNRLAMSMTPIRRPSMAMTPRR